MGRQLAHRLKQSQRGLGWGSNWGLDWGLAASAAILMVTGAGVVPAQADQIESWHYDSQGRSLTLVLPPNVAPALSVLAPNRLLVELPNTQVGDVAAQTVADGVVESIVLEQTDPDTVWMVVEFAPGTVLADAQSAVQIGTEPDNLQRWQVQPVLAGSAEISPTTPSALALSPAIDLAQAPDFPDLPLLEPAVQISEPVSVPPIDAVRPVAPIEPEPAPQVNRTVDLPLPTAVIPAEAPIPGEADLLERLPEADLPMVDLPVVDQLTTDSLEPDQSVADEPVADEPVADEPAPDSREAVAVSQPEVPLEPPFLEGVAESAAIPEAPEVPAESIATVPPPAAAPATPTAVEAPLLEIPAERVSPANVSRWPEPIPFGQPLP